MDIFKNKSLNYKADTLVEVLVASVLIVIAATALLRTTVYGKVLTNKAMHRCQAASFASQVVNELKMKGEDDYNDAVLSAAPGDNPHNAQTELSISLPTEITDRGGSANYSVILKTEGSPPVDVGKEIIITVQWNEDATAMQVETATLIPNIP